MKKVLSGMAIVAAFCFAGSVALAQDAANGEKTYKAKCADEIQKQITTSPKHTTVKNLTAAEVKDLAAYLATLK